MSPRLKILYLIGVAVAAFVAGDARIVGAIALVQLGLWWGAAYGFTQPFRLIKRLGVFFFFVLLSFAFFPEEGGDPRWYEIPVGGWSFSVSLAGLADGGLMCLRIYTVILTSMLVRRNVDSERFVEGLQGIFLPRTLALSLDATLHLLEPEQQKKLGGGGGMGGGKGKGRNKKFTVVLRDVLRGDVSFFTDGIAGSLSRARAYALEKHRDLDEHRATDLAVISGITLTMLTLKWLKVLPGLPFAPGHKTVLLLPLYILASELTYTRWGGTLVGSCMGIMGFLMGDGRYGIFEVFKHIAPGLIIDLLLPVFRAREEKIPGPVAYGLLGLLAAFGRFATIVLIIEIVGAPPAFYAIAAPLALVHLGFGAASGVVSYGVMKGLRRFKITAGLVQPVTEEEAAAAAAPAPSNPGGGGNGRGGGGGRGSGRRGGGRRRAEQGESADNP